MEKNENISAIEITRKFKISYQTVNHYTNLGLLTVRKRKGNGRFYSESEVRERLDKVNKLKNEGYPLRIICKMI